MKPLLALLLILTGTLMSQDQKPTGAPHLPQSADVGTTTADTIYVNANIWTGVMQGRTIATAQGLAVKGDRIVAVGTNDEIKKHKGSKN